MSDRQQLFALFIDGDNIDSSSIQEILDKVGSLGKILIKKVYNNKASMNHWEAVISKYSLDAVWVPNNTKSKNSVDIALVVEAMTLLYNRPDLTSFCIVSSDGDYTALAKQIRTANKVVLGIGEQKTPEPFRNACDEFIFIENLVPPKPAKPKKTADSAPPAPRVKSPAKPVSSVASAPPDAVSAPPARQRPAQGRASAPTKVPAPVPSAPTSQNAPTPQNAPKAKNAPNAKNTTNQKNRPAETPAPAAPPAASVSPLSSEAGGNGSDELSKFRQAYRRAVDILKIADADGWVYLSPLAMVLKHLFPDYQPLVYRGTKHSQLKKVVEHLIKDYPSIFELNTDSHNPRLRIKE